MFFLFHLSQPLCNMCSNLQLEILMFYPETVKKHTHVDPTQAQQFDNISMTIACCATSSTRS